MCTPNLEQSVKGPQTADVSYGPIQTDVFYLFLLCFYETFLFDQWDLCDRCKLTKF